MIVEKITSFVETRAMDERGTAFTPDTPLLDSGIIDSTGVLELVSFLESEFGIKIQDEEIVPEHFDTIAKIAAFVETKKRG